MKIKTVTLPSRRQYGRSKPVWSEPSLKILIIKLSSMGDLVHLLPALSDAQSAHPHITFDWVVDRAFAEIPKWHTSVNTVIESNHRQWKKQGLRFFLDGTFKGFKQALNQKHYDGVIDAQSSIKSALVARLCKAPRHGMNKHSVREGPATWFYQHRYPVPKNMHAIDRLRLLFSQVLGYSLPETPARYGIQLPEQPEDFTGHPHYLVFVPNASWPTKLWQNTHWHALLRMAGADYNVIIPSGSETEYQRAQALAKGHAHVNALPRQSLSQTAHLIARAAGVVTTDTGLGHIAAALDVPAVSLYGPTDTRLIGATGRFQQHLLDNTFHCRPCYRKSCHYTKERGSDAACMTAIKPQAVWHALTSQMGHRKNWIA